MSDGSIAAYLAKHPKLTTAFMTILLVVSQSGVAAAAETTYPGP